MPSWILGCNNPSDHGHLWPGTGRANNPFLRNSAIICLADQAAANFRFAAQPAVIEDYGLFGCSQFRVFFTTAHRVA